MEKVNKNRRDIFVGGATLLGGALLPSSLFAAESDVFRIGALNSISGSGSSYGPGMQKVIVAMAEQINASGGAGGRKFQVFAEDDQTKPEVAVLAAKKLLDVNKVQAILGTFSSGVTLAVMPLTDKAGAILMNTSGAPSISEQNVKGFSWRFEASNDRYGKAFYEAVKRGGFKRPATMAFNNASGLSNTEGFRKNWQEHGGKVVEAVVYEPNRPSYRSELQKILEAKPDVVVMGSYLQDTTIILREWYQSGYDLRWVIPSWAGNAELIKALGPEVCEGVMTVGTISNEGSPALARFNQLYEKEMGKPGSTNTYAAMCYDMVVTLALAMEAAGRGASNEAINQKIREVAGASGTVVSSFEEGKAALKKGRISYQGASSRLNFNARGDASPDFSISMIKKGEIVRVSRVQI
jgi:branched-chain amino acid transport system substrate-binding protein